MELTLKGLNTELEFLRMRVSSLEKALDKAGIEIPPTRQELADRAAAEDPRRPKG